MSKVHDNLQITQSNHTNRLPNAKSNPRSNATVQTLHTVRLVDVPKGIPDRHLLRPIRILRLALHLHADDLNGLIPRAKTATNRRRSDLLHGA